ncbi:FAD-binding oxidoreductase [Almyronema epifaneia]|uniref:FAD-binding oxidoreductase n=1 Tax=Almyronema epifaneia S1 TaxID=2991925 RepID=A0ABW6IJ29_9CYAN
MAAIAQQLEALLTPQQVIRGEQLEPTWIAKLQQAIAANAPQPCVVYPQAEAELVEVVRCAYKNGWRILPAGQASKLHWGGLATQVDVVVSTGRLNRLLHHAVGDLVFTAEAGLSFASLQTTLAATQQFLAIDPAYPAQATLGGIVATADTGALRQRYNSVRDMLIGIHFVRHDGQTAKAGGQVVKNVAGYDLMKLLTGSYGSLALISQVTFRTYPLPESSETVLVTGAPAAIAQLCRTLKTSVLTPVSLDVLSAELLSALGHTAAAGLAVRFQTIQAGVVAQVDQLKALCQSLKLQLHLFTQTADGQFWSQIQAILWSDKEATANTVSCKLGIPPAKVAEFLAAIERFNRPGELQVMGRIHVGSGLGTLRLAGAIAAEPITQLRSHCEALGGFLTLLQAPLELKQQIDIWGYRGNALELMRQLKHQFDPHCLSSPGRFVGGI